MTEERSGVSSFGMKVLSMTEFLNALRVVPALNVSFFGFPPPSWTEVIWISLESSEGSEGGSECWRKLRRVSEI